MVYNCIKKRKRKKVKRERRKVNLGKIRIMMGTRASDGKVQKRKKTQSVTHSQTQHTLILILPLIMPWTTIPFYILTLP